MTILNKIWANSEKFWRNIIWEYFEKFWRKIWGNFKIKYCWRRSKFWRETWKIEILEGCGENFRKPEFGEILYKITRNVEEVLKKIWENCEEILENIRLRIFKIIRAKLHFPLDLSSLTDPCQIESVLSFLTHTGMIQKIYPIDPMVSLAIEVVHDTLI